MEKIKENSQERQTAAIGRGYELLRQVKKEATVYVRDDQHPFNWLIDSIRASRRENHRFQLVDTGAFDSFQMEWLGEAGADIFSSDLARTELQEIVRIQKACRRGASFMAYFLYGPLAPAEKAGALSLAGLRELGRSGVFLHLSNRERERTVPELVELARDCRRGKSWLVFYYHGPMISELEDLAGAGAWIHISDKSLAREDDVALLGDIQIAAAKRDTKIVLHVEAKTKLRWLKDIFAAGACLLFKTPPSDYRSARRVLEHQAKKKMLDGRSYYLHPTYLP